MTKRPGFGWDQTPHDLVMQHLGYSADQVRDLLPFVAGEQQAEQDAVAVACIDSFVLNVRLIADFFRSTQERDVRPRDIVPDWTLDSDLLVRLGVWHDMASKYAMHMSWRRFDDGPPISVETYREMAADVLAARSAFVKAYRSEAEL